jgi:hypothetical protein
MNKKLKPVLAAAALMLAASVIISPNAKADGLAPGEGYFAGAFVGFGTGILQADVDTTASVRGNLTGDSEAASFDVDRGGLGLSGIQGGGWAGWGMKTADDLYFGAEVSAAGSEEKIKLTSSKALSIGGGPNGNAAATDITSISTQRLWSAGGAVRVGYYVNKDTLFALKGGIAVSRFDVDIGTSSEQYLAGGPQFGGSVETRLSKIDPNLSLRMEFVYTDYLSADFLAKNGQGSVNGGAGADVELTGHDSAGRIGVQYSF